MMEREEDYTGVGVMSRLEYYAKRGLNLDGERLYREFCSATHQDEKKRLYRDYRNGILEDAIKVFGPSDRCVKILEKKSKLMKDEIKNGE